MSDLLLALWHLLVTLAQLWCVLYAAWAAFYKIPKLMQEVRIARKKAELRDIVERNRWNQR
ncbi:hypothetical protein EDF28_3581 [Curtobacterium sp. PhB137]|uniref:hypothetical protein n=1 Tax=Curtobacterium sp. PhB137 TaxID=2485182 RepID=UPI000F50ED39|nr:hypothetical protein [Curtobacterium sp. PhB137]RPE75636.1 hypothetical protein EDF28_3581 [Curtobacterium sp. PhB137]